MSDDETLFEQYRQGDETAFEELFKRYERKLYGFFLKRLNYDRDDAEDCYQTTWMKIHRSRDRFDPEQSFRVWLFSIAYNVLKDRYRTRSQDAFVEEPDVVERSSSAPAQSETELLNEEKKTELKRAMGELPEKQREVLWLHRYEELSYSEIGELRDESEQAVKQKAYRAYQTLREILPDWVAEEEQ